MSILTFTDAALKRFQELKGDASGFSIKVVGGGCSGLKYDIKKVEETPEHEQMQSEQDVNFYIHPMTIPYIKGMTVDYSDDLMDGGFKFINPNASSSCGCGTSFGT